MIDREKAGGLADCFVWPSSSLVWLARHPNVFTALRIGTASVSSTTLLVKKANILWWLLNIGECRNERDM